MAGNGFPGLAIVSLIALLVALGIALLVVAQPWAPATIAPQLRVAPDIDVAVGDAVELPSAQRLALAPARRVAAGGTSLVAAEAAAEEGAEEGGGRPQLGIAPARVVADAAPAHSPGASPEQPAPEAPAPPPVVPAPVPVSLPPPEPSPPPAPAGARPGGEMQGPIAAGGGVVGGGGPNVLQVCEGDDYTLSISPSVDTNGGEAQLPVDPVRHDLTIYFGNSSDGTGFYLVFLDAQPVEIRDGLAAVEPGQSCAQIDLGLLLGESIETGAEIHVEAVALDESLEPVLP